MTPILVAVVRYIAAVRVTGTVYQSINCSIINQPGASLNPELFSSKLPLLGAFSWTLFSPRSSSLPGALFSPEYRSPTRELRQRYNFKTSKRLNGPHTATEAVPPYKIFPTIITLAHAISRLLRAILGVLSRVVLVTNYYYPTTIGLKIRYFYDYKIPKTKYSYIITIKGYKSSIVEVFYNTTRRILSTKQVVR